MVKYKVLKRFRDIYTGEIYEQMKVIDFTIERAKEVEKNLDRTFLIRVSKFKE